MPLAPPLLRIGLLAVLGACHEEPVPAGAAQTAPSEPSKPSEEARRELDRARALFATDEPFDAVAPARRAVELAPDWAEARLSLGKLLLNFSAIEFSTGVFDRGRIGEAIVHLERACELDPKSADAAYWAGRALFKAARIPEAVRRLEAALATNPRHGLARKELGLLYAAEGDVQRSNEHLRLARELLPRDDEVLFQIGLHLEGEDRLEQARDVYLEAAALNPAHPGPPTRLVAVYRRLGDAAAAERASAQFERTKEFGKRMTPALKRAREQSQDPAALTTVAVLYHEMGMQAPARSWAERALRLDPEHAPAKELLRVLGPAPARSESPGDAGDEGR